MSKRGGVSARNYVLHIDPSATWSRQSATEVNLISGPESSKVRCGRVAKGVNRAGTGTYAIEEFCWKCWTSAQIDGGR